VVHLLGSTIVYANFTEAQKCWAHLLRKAIKLTLQDPNNAAYRSFTDRLLEIYREACRVQRDGRLSDAGRARKVSALDDEVFDLCVAYCFPDEPPSHGLEKDYHLLVQEVLRLLLRQELLTFVTAQAALARPKERLVGSSEVIESVLGKLKRIEQDQATGGFTGLVLSLGAIVSQATEAVIQKALETVSTQDVWTWCHETLGTSVQAQRRQLMKLLKRTEQKRDQLPATT